MDKRVCAFDVGWHSQRNQLGASDIHLCVVDFSKLDTQNNLDLLSATEKTRAQDFLDHHQRTRFLGGRIALRLLLCKYTGLANTELEFASGARGKLILQNHNHAINFNYSTSGNIGLYALAKNRRLGVDLELLPRKLHTARLAKRKLTATEQKALAALPAAHRQTAALQCWTRKEAHGKALGVGIRYPMMATELFAQPHLAHWNCCAHGDQRIIHGVQLHMPFAAVAALAYDGDALDYDNANALYGWRFTARTAIN